MTFTDLRDWIRRHLKSPVLLIEVGTDGSNAGIVVFLRHRDGADEILRTSFVLMLSGADPPLSAEGLRKLGLKVLTKLAGHVEDLGSEERDVAL